MNTDLHANPTTTPKQRDYIQESDKPAKGLAEEAVLDYHESNPDCFAGDPHNLAPPNSSGPYTIGSGESPSVLA